MLPACGQDLLLTPVAVRSRVFWSWCKFTSRMVGRAGSWDFWLQGPGIPGAGVRLMVGSTDPDGWPWGSRGPEASAGPLISRAGSQLGWLLGPGCPRTDADLLVDGEGLALVS